MTRREAAILRLCMICGKPDALLIRLDDGRNVRACDYCLSHDEYWMRYEIRDPLPSEIPGAVTAQLRLPVEGFA